MSTAASPMVSVLAPAKLNLYLHVLGRRPDGYHILDSLIVFPNVGDRLEVRVCQGLRLTVNGPFAAHVPTGPDNSVLRAARALADTVGLSAHAAITLTKMLPVASGIGGGSADAAAALRALLQFWRIRLEDERMQQLALSLGADVPVCLGARPAFIGGIGERIDPAPDLPAFSVILINPLIPLPTAPVFARLGGPYSRPSRFNGIVMPDARALAESLAQRRNDLAAAAMAIVPEVAGVLDALADTPGVLLARMSGSGATCFGLCETVPAAVSGARALAARHPEWWVKAAAVAAGVGNG